MALGFDLFEGFFFAKPEVLTKSARTVSSTAAIALLAELQSPDVSLKRLEQLVITDPTIAFRLISLVNSSVTGLATRVDSVYRDTAAWAQELRAQVDGSSPRSRPAARAAAP